MTLCKATGRPVHDCDFCQGRSCAQHPADVDCDCDDEGRHQDVRTTPEGVWSVGELLALSMAWLRNVEELLRDVPKLEVP